MENGYISTGKGEFSMADEDGDNREWAMGMVYGVSGTLIPSKSCITEAVKKDILMLYLVRYFR